LPGGGIEEILPASSQLPPRDGLGENLACPFLQDAGTHREQSSRMVPVQFSYRAGVTGIAEKLWMRVPQELRQGGTFSLDT